MYTRRVYVVFFLSTIAALLAVGENLHQEISLIRIVVLTSALFIFVRLVLGPLNRHCEEPKATKQTTIP